MKVKVKETVSMPSWEEATSVRRRMGKVNVKADTLGSMHMNHSLLQGVEKAQEESALTTPAGGRKKMETWRGTLGSTHTTGAWLAHVISGLA